jgi:hypothetical protein
MDSERRESPWMRFAWGAVLLTAGVIFWLDRMDRLRARDYLEWWPAALILIGLAHLPQKRWGGALVWITIGTLFLLPRLGFPSLSMWRLIGLWPLLISVAGANLVVQALRPRMPGARFNAMAVMAANTLQLGSQQLAGGEAVAVMGGCELDLSAARAASDEVAIHVVAFWGGIEITVPRGWRVENHVLPLLGGVEDNTAAAPEGAPRLVVRGSAIMGGIELRHSKEERV